MAVVDPGAAHGIANEMLGRVMHAVPLRRLVTAMLVLLATSAAAGAQQPPRPDSARFPDECYRFRFGPWAPPLDWAAAGHRPMKLPPPSAQPSGRGDASHDGAPGDSVLMLYPDWWPVGVLVRFHTRSASGDTLYGEASALVADANALVPTSRVKVIRVPCHAPSGAARQDAPIRGAAGHAARAPG